MAMEKEEIYRASASLRKNNSSVWRNSGADVFSRSSRDEDDEEALIWAAIEKLPTYNRLRKGLLLGLEGEASEVDINNLGLEERRNLVERLVKIAEEDNEKFLQKLKNRIDRCDSSPALGSLPFPVFSSQPNSIFLRPRPFSNGFSCLFHFSRVGIDLPEIEVRFEQLTIDAEAYVGSRALPSFFNSAFNQIEVNSMQMKSLAKEIMLS